MMSGGSAGVRHGKMPASASKIIAETLLPGRPLALLSQACITQSLPSVVAACIRISLQPALKYLPVLAHRTLGIAEAQRHSEIL